MYASNLAIVFGPSLLRPPSIHWYERRQAILQGAVAADVDEISSADDASGVDSELVMTMKHLGACNTIVKNMILQYHWLFDVDQEVTEDGGAEDGSEEYLEEVVVDTEQNPVIEEV
jgi:hypothetical protein